MKCNSQRNLISDTCNRLLSFLCALMFQLPHREKFIQNILATEQKNEHEVNSANIEMLRFKRFFLMLVLQLQSMLRRLLFSCNEIFFWFYFLHFYIFLSKIER